MDRLNQYNMLKDIAGKAKFLVANSKDDITVAQMEKVSELVERSAVSLGFSDAKFNSDAIVRCRELKEEYR